MADNQQPQHLAESQPTQVIDASTDDKGVAAAKTVAEHQPVKTRLLWLMVLLNIGLLCVTAYGGYWFINTRTITQAKLDDAQSRFTQSLLTQEQQTKAITDAIHSDLNQQAETGESLLDAQHALQQQVNDMALALKRAESMFNDLQSRRPSDWLVAEADYLVRMAGRKMWLERDVRTAIMLLANADKRLQSMSDPSVLPVRALIAQDIQALEQVNTTSEISVALALDGMFKQIVNLPFNTPVENYAAPDSSVSTSASDWQQNLLHVWQAIVDDFIRIEVRDTPVEPMMTAKQQWLLQEQLKLALQQAQSAALASEQTLYVASLEQALLILNTGFQADSAPVSGFKKALMQLEKTDISKAIPTKLNAQSALESLLDSRVKNVFGEGVSAL